MQGGRQVKARAQLQVGLGLTSGSHFTKTDSQDRFLTLVSDCRDQAHCHCWLPGRPPPPPSGSERLPLTLIPFEFPRPFDTFDTWSFLVPLCSEMLANTLFDMTTPPFDTFATLVVLSETLQNSHRMAFLGPQVTTWTHKTLANSHRMAFWVCFSSFSPPCRCLARSKTQLSLLRHSELCHVQGCRGHYTTGKIPTTATAMLTPV